MEYSLLEDKELFDKLDKSIMSEEFLNSKQGELIKESAKRSWEKALIELCYKVDLSDISKVALSIAVIRKFKYELLEDLKIFAQEGEIAFEEAKFRNIAVNLTETR